MRRTLTIWYDPSTCLVNPRGDVSAYGCTRAHTINGFSVAWMEVVQEEFSTLFPCLAVPKLETPACPNWRKDTYFSMMVAAKSSWSITVWALWARFHLGQRKLYVWLILEWPSGHLPARVNGRPSPLPALVELTMINEVPAASRWIISESIMKNWDG